MTLPSGEVPTTGMSKQTTKPLLRTSKGVFRVNIMFSYSWSAIGSCFDPCSTYREISGYGLISSAANFVISLPFWNQIKFRYHKSELAFLFALLWGWLALVASSILLIIVSSTTRVLMSAFSESSKLSGKTKSLHGFRERACSFWRNFPKTWLNNGFSNISQQLNQFHFHGQTLLTLHFGWCKPI